MAIFRFLLVSFVSLTTWPTLAQEEEQNKAQEISVQEEAQPTQKEASSPSSGRIEKLEVTGSHIKRIDVEGPSPVLTLDRDYLDRSGFNSVADVLRDNTVSGLGSGREAGLSGGALTGAATTSIRGMGSDSVLVLLDGQRLPTIGGGTSVDLNLIPMAAIERIEILKDGASALYGSDALGGVINFITKKDFDGASIALNHAQPEGPGGARSDLTASYGKSGSNYNILAVGQYRSNKNIAMRDRDFFIPTPEFWSPTGSPGSYSNHDNAENWTAGGGSDPCTGPIDSRGRCRFDYSPYMQVIPDIDQYSALLSGSYDTGEIKFFGQAVATRREVRSVLAPAPDGFQDQSNVGGLDTRLPKTLTDTWGLSGITANPNPQQSGKDVNVIYRLVEEGGSRINDVITDTASAMTGAKGYFSETWDWEATANYSFSETSNRGVSGYANKLLLRDQAVAGNFNPFAAPGTKNDISSTFYVPELLISSNIGGFQLKATGELFDLPYGPLAMAVGSSAYWQYFKQSSDSITNSGAQWGGGTSAEGKGSRDFQSAFVEFSAMALSDLELQFAGRFDNFSDFGSTINPKVGAKYKPFSSLMLRSSWGTGFKAPGLEDVYGGQTVSYPFGFDPVNVEVAQYQTFGGGNRNLQEETSESFNFGLVWQILDRLSFGADYYYNNQDNLVYSGNLRDLFLAEQAGVDLSEFNMGIFRDPPNTGKVARILAPTLNLSTRKTEGLEFRLAYDQPLSSGWRLDVVTDYSMILRLDESPFPGIPIEKRVGFYGNPYWRTNTSVSVSNISWGFNLLSRTIGEQNKSLNSPGEGGKTRDYTEFDIRAQYTAFWNASIAVGVRNVLATERPWHTEHTSSGFINTSLYDPFGRTVFMNYTQNF